MIVAHEDIRARVLAMYRAGGLPKGTPVGWPSVDALYTVGLGQWTLVTGQPHSGKSEWLDAVMVNLAKQEEWVFVIYSPENWPLELHHSKILEKYVGKPFSPGRTPRMDEEELDEAEEWMKGKFRFAKPPRPDIFSILSEAAETLTFRAKLGIVVDPWNQLDHNRPAGLSETEYISQTLSECIRFVRDANCHLWIVAHPSKMLKDKSGKLPVPTPNDVSGSSHWWAKSDNCICVWREQGDNATQEVEIHVQKVRHRNMGRTGMATIRYDKTTGKYYEILKAAPSASDYRLARDGE